MATNGSGGDTGDSSSLSTWLTKPSGDGGKGSRYDALASLLDKSAFAGRILVVYIWFWILLAIAMAIFHLKDPEGAELGWIDHNYPDGIQIRRAIPVHPLQPTGDQGPDQAPDRGRPNPPHPWRRGAVACPDGTTFGN